MKLVTTGVGAPLKVSVHFSIFLMLLRTLLPLSFTILFYYLGNGVVETRGEYTEEIEHFHEEMHIKSFI